MIVECLQYVQGSIGDDRLRTDTVFSTFSSSSSTGMIYIQVLAALVLHFIIISMAILWPCFSLSGKGAVNCFCILFGRLGHLDPVEPLDGPYLPSLTHFHKVCSVNVHTGLHSKFVIINQQLSVRMVNFCVQ